MEGKGWEVRKGERKKQPQKHKQKQQSHRLDISSRWPGVSLSLPPHTLDLGLGSLTLGGLHFELAVVKSKNSCESRTCSRVSASEAGGNRDQDVWEWHFKEWRKQTQPATWLCRKFNCPLTQISHQPITRQQPNAPGHANMLKLKLSITWIRP